MAPEHPPCGAPIGGQYSEQSTAALDNLVEEVVDDGKHHDPGETPLCIIGPLTSLAPPPSEGETAVASCLFLCTRQLRRLSHAEELFC